MKAILFKNDGSTPELVTICDRQNHDEIKEFTCYFCSDSIGFCKECFYKIDICKDGVIDWYIDHLKEHKSSKEDINNG